MNSFVLLFQEGGGFGLLLQLAPFLVIFLIFYFLVIVPNKRQKQQLQDMISQLKINDEIVTNGGLIGKIKEIKDTSFVIHSAEKSFIEIGKQSVVGKRAEEK